MNVLIVSGYFYPQNTPRAFRTTELAKRLCTIGHNVTVYIPQSENDYSEFLQSWPIKICQYKSVQERRRFVGISIIDRILFRFLNQFFAYPDRRRIKPLMKALKIESGYDYLITIAMPHSVHWAVGKLYENGKRIAHCWTADCGDPFMLAATNSFKQPFYLKPYEKRWCNLCDFITVPTKASVDGYYPEYRDKIKIIPQGFDFSEIKRKEYKKNQVPTFAYSGIFIPGRRDLRPILDILIKLEVNFVLHVFTSQANLFLTYKEKLGEKLQLHNYIPRLELLEYLSGMDFLLNLENGIAVQTPSKLIDYALTGRPILSLDSSNINEALLSSFINGDYSGKFTVENIEKYNIVNVTQQFLDLYKKVCES